MANTGVFTKVLNREILQVSFRPTLKWLSLRPTISSSLESKYKEWRSDKGNISLYSPDAKRALEILANKITYVSEEVETTGTGMEHIDKLFTKITQDCSISEVRRVGYRRTLIYKSDFNFSELTDLIYTRLFNKSETTKLFSGAVKDLNYVLDADDNGLITHIQIGPTDEKQGAALFATRFNSTDLDKKNYLFFDFDVAIIQGLNSTNTVNNLKKIIDVNNETIEKYIKFLS